MAEKVTLSLSADTLARARRAAHREGASLSGWFERTARRQLLRDAAAHHDEWLAANPDVREELDGFDRLVETLDASWSDPADEGCALGRVGGCRNRPQSALSAGAA